MSFRGFKDWPLIWRRIRAGNLVEGGVEIEIGTRCYSTRDDLKKLRPMILKRIEKRAEFYPVHAMIPVAREVLQTRSSLIHGVSTLLKFVPVLACKFLHLSVYHWLLAASSSPILLLKQSASTVDERAIQKKSIY